jgi:hypothetical protein
MQNRSHWLCQLFRLVLIQPCIQFPMPCPEKDRLQNRFEVAESTWFEVSIAPIVAGVVMNRTPAAVRDEVLHARNAAASELYEHRQGCKVCKRLEIEKKHT